MKIKLALLAAAIVVVACPIVCAQSQKVSEIGGPISKASAQRWIENFKTKHVDETYGHTYGKNIFRKLFSNKDVEGVYAFNGQDGEGNIHLVFKAVDRDGETVKSELAFNGGTSCPPYCPCIEPCRGSTIAQLGNRIDEGLAQQWIGNFQRNNDGRIHAHLFGKDLINEILSKDGIEGAFFAYGLDDKGIEHMVLTGVTGDGDLAWNPPGNEGQLCPPNCPKDYPVVGVAKRN